MTKIGYDGPRPDTDEEIKDPTQETVKPGEKYVTQKDLPTSMKMPASLDPNIGRFNEGTVGENGIGQPIENTQAGMIFGAPLNGHVAPSSEKKKKYDAGKTAYDLIKENAAKKQASDKAKEESFEEKNEYEPATPNEPGPSEEDDFDFGDETEK